jgi:hypothetical protein
MNHAQHHTTCPCEGGYNEVDEVAECSQDKTPAYAFECIGVDCPTINPAAMLVRTATAGAFRPKGRLTCAAMLALTCDAHKGVGSRHPLTWWRGDA